MLGNEYNYASTGISRSRKDMDSKELGEEITKYMQLKKLEEDQMLGILSKIFESMQKTEASQNSDIILKLLPRINTRQNKLLKGLRNLRTYIDKEIKERENE